MRQYKQKLQREVDRFRKVKDDLLSMGLNDLEATVLGAKMMGEPGFIYDEDFLNIKNQIDYRPYLPGAAISITEIISSNKSLNVKLVKRGLERPIILKGQQALLFLGLLILKFEDAERDATYGFESISDIGRAMNRLSEASFTEPHQWNYATLDNLRRKLRPSGLEETLQHLQEQSYRLAISPLRIAFSPEALRVFERYTKDAFTGFCNNYNYNPAELTSFF